MEVRIIISDFTNESATRIAGTELKEKIQSIFTKDDNTKITVDFNGINKFASPFFNNSFAALAILYGFDRVSDIKIENISEVGQMVYEVSLSNAKFLYENPEHQEAISNIVNQLPKGGKI